MEQTYFYLTITGNSLYQIKEKLNLTGFDYYQKGDVDDDFSYLVYEKECLKFFNEDIKNIDELLYQERIAKLLTLPKNVDITVHCVKGAFDTYGSHGLYIDEKILKELALLNANFEFSAKYCRLPMLNNIGNEIYSPIYQNMNQKVYFSLTSYQIPLMDIINKIGFYPNDKSYNFYDKRRCDCPYYFTSFKYKALNKKENIDDQIKTLANDIYSYKDNILALGNELDVSYGIHITGKMPQSYQIFLDKNTLNQLAQMRLSLDFDMYFANGY